MNKSESYIAERIRWRGDQHNLPKQNTYYWENASESLRVFLVCEVGRPVLVSSSADQKSIVLCTKGLIIGNQSDSISINYNQIEDILHPPLSKEMPKSEMDSLKLLLKNGSEEVLKTAKGGEFFALWNILLMLVNFS